LGLISYPIYLWHVWGIQAGNKLNFLPEPIQLLAGIVISCALAALSYHLLEKRFLLLKHKYERSKEGSSSTLAAMDGEKSAAVAFEKGRSN
jgi:peptidoglycan/LPS O-acetylase OafA/YrhL